MSPKPVSAELSVSSQLYPADIGAAAHAGFRAIVNNRPDGEEPGQPTSAELATCAARAGLHYAHVPVVPGSIDGDDVKAFAQELTNAQKPTLAFCRTGTRSATLWALSQAGKMSAEEILAATSKAGYDLATLKSRLARADELAADPDRKPSDRYDVVIVGGGAAGLATAASLRVRDRNLSIAIIEPRTEHHYQPGWTLVGAGVFDQAQTCRSEASLIPRDVTWLRTAVTAFRPDQDEVLIEDGRAIGYRALVVAPGISLKWAEVEGLAETIGRNGVTSNYRQDLAPYTWKLV